MRIMRLLAVGQSIIGVKDGPSRYKMAEQNLLPKFASATRPLASGLTIKSARPGDGSVAKANKTENASFAAKARTDGSPAAIKPCVPAKTAAIPAKGPLSLFKQNPFVSRPATKINRLPVQAELSLDAVKVVRNDLSDADLEIVPVTSGARHERELQRVETCPPTTGDLTNVLWGRLTERWFNGSRARV